MPRFQFSVDVVGGIREAGAIQSDSFDHAIAAICDNVDIEEGATLEIGVAGFPPARFQHVPSTLEGYHTWRIASLMAA